VRFVGCGGILAWYSLSCIHCLAVFTVRYAQDGLTDRVPWHRSQCRTTFGRCPGAPPTIPCPTAAKRRIFLSLPMSTKSLDGITKYAECYPADSCQNGGAVHY
ncbi:uncharacterized protein B0H18DRAFT_985487, partial [Fomitopsis serialis]|uniref:uncharacterized protein n=1 Tax=Fomitopsis serialis TaxID=139415 RepID=UPI00200818C0